MTVEIHRQMASGKKWDGKTRAPGWGIRFFEKMIKWFGLLPAYSFLYVVVPFYTFGKKTHKRNIRAFRSRLGLDTTYFSVFKHNFALGEAMVDRYAQLLRKKSPFTFTHIGEQHFIKALEQGKGLILLSSHIGNQDLAGNLLFHNIKTSINFFMLDNDDPEMKKIFRDMSEDSVVNVIATNQNPVDKMIALKSALDRNEIVCMMGDRVAENEKHYERSFLGSMVKFPTFPYEIAFATRAPIIITCSLKTGTRSYTQKIFSSFSRDENQGITKQEFIQRGVERYVEIIEEIVREYPYQWFNLYDYWDEF